MTSLLPPSSCLFAFPSDRERSRHGCLDLQRRCLCDPFQRGRRPARRPCIDQRFWCLFLASMFEFADRRWFSPLCLSSFLRAEVWSKYLILPPEDSRGEAGRSSAPHIERAEGILSKGPRAFSRLPVFNASGSRRPRDLDGPEVERTSNSRFHETAVITCATTPSSILLLGAEGSHESMLSTRGIGRRPGEFDA